KIRYLLPITPAIAALAGYLFCEGLEHHTQRVLIRAKACLEKLLLVLPVLALIGVWVGFHHSHKQSAAVHLPLALIAALLCICQAFAVAVQWRAPQNYKSLGLLLSAVLAVWVLNLLVLEPMALQMHDTRTFVQQVEALRQQQPGQVAFFKVRKDAAAIKYLVNLNYDLQPKFLNDSADIDAIDSATYLIIREKDLSQAQQSISVQQLAPVLRDHFDHDYYTVFYLPGGHSHP
ncbi:MAG TPA: hypothetical protein VLC91_17280, partial [Spongiibacteraceae bacterium]|nr:hypothetical protein [Spongiibacteraceae bacterium]